MKKINLLAGETSSGSSSTTISNLGLIQLKPLLDIEPKNEIQELYPGDDGVSGYSFIRIKGVNNQDEKIVDASINTQEITPDDGYLGIKKVTVNGVDNTIDKNITADNIKHGVDILGVTGTYAPVTQPIEITPSTQEQVKVPDMGVDGFDSVTVHAVDKNIDSNIQAGNIRKGVEILGVTGEFGVELYDYDNIDFVKDTLVQSGNYADPIEIPVPEGYSGFKSVKLYSVGVEGLTVNPSTNEQTFSKNPGEWYVGYNNVTVNPVTSSIDDNIKPENIIEGVSILGVEGKAGKFEMNISSATVHNTYSGNGEERPTEDRSSTLRYRYRIGFFDEYNNGCLSNLLGIIYSVNDTRSNDVYLYAKDFSNHLALGTDKRWRSVYIYSDTPFNNIANLHVYFFYKDNKVPQFAFYGDQHIENYFLNNSYLLNLKDNNSIGQYAYGQIAQYPKPEFPESSLNGLNSWVNVYNKTTVPISFIGIQEVSNFNFGDTMYAQNDNSFIGNSTITGNHLDNSTLSPMAYKLVSNKNSKPTFLCNVNSGTGHICSFYTNNDKYTADISEYSTNVSLSYSETMSHKACTITNVDDIIVGSNVRVLSIKFGGDNYNPQRIFILRTSGFDTLTLEKDGDLSNTNIELVVPDSYSHNEVKSKLEEIGYTVTVNKLSTTDSSSQRYYFYTTNYGRHKFLMNDVAVPTDQWDYDLLIHTTGNKASSFPQIVDEDGKQYLIFCNGNINLESCLYGFGYRTSYVRFSYHTYSAELFKKIGDFIYVDATTLGGVANSDGIFVTYDFNDHNIPEKFYFNCGNGDSISVGTSCKKCGVDAFNFDNNDYVITRKFFEYNVNYIPNGLKKTTIDNIINRGQVRTIKICNEDNVINNNYPTYSDFDGMNYNSYHLSVKTAGPGVATDETDSKYVDISKFTYKKQFAAVDITPDIDVVGCYTDRIDNITIVNNSDNYKIVVQDDGTVWMYANNIMDSSGGYTILLHYKKDNPRIKEFSFFNLSNVTEFVAYKPMTLGYCSLYHDNDRCTFIGNARLVNVEALALFGFRILNFETNTINYAACGTRADASFYNVRVISSSFDETDYTQTINNSGKLTVDLSPVFVLGGMSNSSWASLSNTYSCSHVNFVFGTDARKISNRNQILDIANYSDEGGQHEYDLDISEIPADKYSQSIVLNNVGQVINGNRCITETYTRMLNLFIPLNSRFRFEGTFSETQLRNDATHITNVVMFNPPENNTFHNGFSHNAGNEQVLKFYYDEQYDITNFKTTIETEFDNVQTEFHPMTIICDNLKDCRYESGKNYGFVHSSRKRHSLIVVP